MTNFHFFFAFFFFTFFFFTFFFVQASFLAVVGSSAINRPLVSFVRTSTSSYSELFVLTNIDLSQLNKSIFFS
ncbi:MAG TPA: hypothetical protein DCS66_00750 [Flavobacteriaceae bacterium]|nr:hypothetical protein [Flavobacteriaceae bacterium]